MSEPTSIDAAASRIGAAAAGISNGLIERGLLVDSIILTAVAGEHLLVIGPPGTAKSEAVRRVAGAVGGMYFEYLLGKFTEPSEIFGPVDLRKLREGVVETETAGMLPEADIAFLDEIFLGSTAILNTLLGILNERVFRRGHTRMHCPLRLCVGAANALPQDESLAAFADRFLVRVFVEPIADPQLEDLLEGGWKLGATSHVSAATSLDDLELLAGAVRGVDLAQVRPHLAQALRMLRKAGVMLSDRRSVKAQRLIAAATVLAGRSTATDADLWPLLLAVPTQEEQAIARETLRDLLVSTENRFLPTAAEELSQGPLARATRIAAFGRDLLAARPASPDPTELAGWQLRLEGVAREIDAGFTREALPAALAEVRGQIVALLEPEVSTA